MEFQIFWTIFIFSFPFQRVSTSFGTKFLIVCPESDTIPPTDFLLYITVPNQAADFTITTPLLGTNLGSYTNVLKSESREIVVSSTFMLFGTGLSNNTILVTSTTDVSVYLIARHGGDGYTAIPITSLHKAYYIVTKCDQYNTCQFSVTAIELVQVEITLTISNGESVTLNSVSYGHGDTISQTLSPFQTLQIRCNSDLTGTLVISNKPVFVVAGGAVGSNSSVRHLLMEQMPPVRSFGREILTIPSQNSQSEGDYCFVSSQPETTIQIGGIVRRYLEIGGEWFTLRLNGSQFVFADKPILVIRISQTGIADTVSEWSTMLLMIPSDQFLAGDTIGVLLPGSPASSSRVISVVRSLSEPLTVNSIVQSGFTTIPGDGLYIKYTSTSSPTTSQEVLKSNVSGLAVYYQINADGYSVSLIGAMNFIETNSDCVASDTSIGDMVDNDCDGLIDEDVCPSHGSPADYLGKDCQQIVSGTMDSYGLRFVAVLPQNIGNNIGTVGFVLSTFSSEIVLVNASVPRNLSRLDTQISVNGTNHLGDLFDLELSGSGVFNMGLLFEASHEISLYSITDSPVSFKSSGAMRLLPVEALGREYYAVTVCDSFECQIQVVAAHPTTVVQIKLNLQDVSKTIDYGGKTYHHGDLVVEYLNQYQAWQLQTTIDITGSRITSNKPIAVFSGGRFTSFLTGQMEDMYTEQLHPVKLWGKTFAVVQATHASCLNLASRNCDDVIRVISHQENTIIKINFSAFSREYTLRYPGDWINIDLKNWAYIESSKPISVMHMLTTGIYYDGGMTVVPPINDYIQRDVITILDIGHTVELVIITEKQYRNEILLNDAIVNFTESLDVNMTYYKFNVTPGETYIISTQHASARFGGYIVSSKVSAAGYFFSLASYHHFNNIPCELSKDIGGDGKDNDCDGKIDEEICDLNITPIDDDLDGLMEEDCIEIILSSSTILSSTFESTILQTMDSSELLSTSDSGYTTLVSSENIFPTTLPTVTLALETSSVLVLTQGESVCTCGCVTWSITTSLDSQSLVEVTDSIKTELTVDSKETSKTVRKLTSAPDPRPSAQTVGYFGIAIISGIFIGIFILDAGALFTDLRKLVQVLKEAKRR